VTDITLPGFPEARINTLPGSSVTEITLPGFPEARIITLHSPLIDISSTQIRHRLQTNQSIRYLVPDPVRKRLVRKE
jgi:nicotinic acid mononucleotide adenylyltransferase